MAFAWFVGAVVALSNGEEPKFAVEPKVEVEGAAPNGFVLLVGAAPNGNDPDALLELKMSIYTDNDGSQSKNKTKGKKHKTMEQPVPHMEVLVFGISNPISYFGATGEKRNEIK